MSVLHEQADHERERQADRGEQPRVREDHLVLPQEPIAQLVDEQPGKHGDRADEGHHDDVEVRVDGRASGTGWARPVAGTVAGLDAGSLMVP